ncbi:MAG TPA: hypothetical protein VF143_00750 [Candidatus Nanopelagicales bacterium]
MGSDRRRAVGAISAATITLLILAGCGTAAPPSDPPGAAPGEVPLAAPPTVSSTPGLATPPAASPGSPPMGLPAAQAYADALLAATRRGFTNTAPFYAPGAQQDLRFLVDFSGSGRATIVQAARDYQQMPPRSMGGWDQSDAHEATRVQPIFLGRTDLLDVRAIPSCGYTVADRMTVAAEGITRETMAGSVDRAEFFHSGWVARARPIVERYLGAWTAGSGEAVAALYTPDAVLTDSLGSMRVVGPTTIAARAGADAARGGLPGARLTSGSAAVFLRGDLSLLGPRAARLEGLTLLLTVGSPSCGDELAVDLTLDAADLIRGEERFHRIDRLGTCGGAAVPGTGWWQSARIPSVPQVRRTADLPTAVAGVHPIALWNGDPRVDPIVAWARARFAAAGLPPPEPASVTFLPAVPGDRWATYGFATGTSAIDLALPFTADEACVDASCSAWRATAKAATLHELAHLWTVRGASPLPSPGTWDPAGADRAAETITWGLMDEPYRVDPRLGAPSCARLTADFETLTNSSPVGLDCVSPAGG